MPNNSKPEPVVLQGRDMRMVRLALRLQAHALLSRANAIAQKSDPGSLSDMCACAEDAERLFRIVGALEEGVRVAIEPIEEG